MNFGKAIEQAKEGCKIKRKGWNGVGIFVKLQRPDALSKMTQPYLYIDTTGLVSSNPDVVKGRIPWLPSQSDMLSEDWITAD